jgi:molybdate transport system ATP-binding protein
MLEVEIEHRLGAFALGLAFTAGPGLTALFGRSGSGKTSIVNIIAGLVRPERGRVVVDGTVLLDTAQGIAVPKHQRRVGYVFQEARLFPHLTVRQNLLFGRWFTPSGERRSTLEQIVSLLGIEALLERRPSALSGGEKQRVAIGRALLASPRLLLMDEPLAALDAPRKEEILPYIERLRDETKLPIVYVSHSVAEVTRLATTVVLMAEGRAVAVGPVAETLSRFSAAQVTDEGEAAAVLEAVVAAHDERFQTTTLRCGAGALTVPRLDLPPGARVRLRILARDVILGIVRPEGLSARNVLAGRVAELEPTRGAVRDLRVDLAEGRLLARVTQRSFEELGLSPGREVFAIIKSVAIAPHGFGRPAAPVAFLDV